MLPKRVHNVTEARQKYGDLVDRMSAYLDICDPLADDVVADLAELSRREALGLIDKALGQGLDATPEAPGSLGRLFEEIEQVPVWVDWERIDRGGRILLRTGILGGIILGAKSLVHGYCAPAGNKPLMFSGRLQKAAPRRIQETMRFVQAVTLPGGMRRHGDGFASTVKVRLMHAQVRILLRRSGRWDAALWSEPINQHDMLATIFLFSSVFLMGLRQLGFQVSFEESEDFMHLWRYVGYVIGVDPELLPATEAEAIRMQEYIHLTQGPPDDDSRALVEALLQVPLDAAQDQRQREAIQQRIRIMRGVCRYLIGDPFADALGLPASPVPYLMRGLRPVLASLDRFSQLPLLKDASLRLGMHYWNQAVELAMRQKPVTFQSPEKLAVG